MLFIFILIGRIKFTYPKNKIRFKYGIILCCKIRLTKGELRNGFWVGDS